MSRPKTELKRLVKFADSLGVKVHFVEYSNRNYHGCYIHPEKFDPGIIEICRAERTPYTFQIITLLHEIGHHLDFLESGRIPDSYNLIDSENCPDWARRAIFNAEHRAVKHAEKLYWTMRLRIPFWKVKMELSADIFLYRTFRATGQYPKELELNEFRRKWKKRYKKRFTNIVHPGDD